MSRVLRSRVLRFRAGRFRAGRSLKADESAASPSEGLRRRVLRTVRSEAPPHDDTLTRQRHRLIASAVAVAALATATAAIAVGQGLLSPSPPGAVQGARPSRAPLASLLVSARRAELVVSHMPEPPIGEVYELWLIRGGGVPPRPTDALFTVTSRGNGAIAVPGGVRGVREVMVTSEPLGGSSSPTSAAVLRLRVGHGH